ncbi:multidrug transporter AcrB [Pseudidiomarina aestuarii]|uniref:Multidrug transporter AcrB n=1 Tax=Pseudidiomarina aestuarii TaxID=624146 RepID=A0A6N4DEX0_9GAMM|nr:multidrug transporter AcrB [Pseudidiomarina aestuarii]
MSNRLGIAGGMAQWALNSRLTPLLALFGLVLGIFAALITPREEEPQIDVTMADVMVALPGARAEQVEQQLVLPLEQAFSRMQGIEHVYAVARPGQALITVQFEVGVARQTALVQLFDVVAQWQYANPQASPPLVKAQGIDDVPILGLTLTADELDLKSVADTLVTPLKNVNGVRDIAIIGAEPEQVTVTLNPTALARAGLDINTVSQALQSYNQSAQAGYRLQESMRIPIQAGGFIDSLATLEQLVIGVVDGKPLRLGQVAELSTDGALPTRYVWTRTRESEAQQAITLTVTKKPGENAVEIAEAVLTRLNTLQAQWLPTEVNVDVTRNYGETADAKASQLIQKLAFATLSVVLLVLFTLGRKEAVVVGSAVILTLATTLFASWAWGFTLNRVSLFALIFSIGILVDDAIVVVENIHRHRGRGGKLKDIIPQAVEEVGGPTILATFTVIAALLPMAFVSGLMGPYMSPIPINASLGMLLSLIIALTVTPWLAQRLIGKTDSLHTSEHEQDEKLQRLFQRIMQPLLSSRKKRYTLGFGLIGLIVLVMGLAVIQAVVLKMLPFDNKSEIQVVLDMPEGSPLEQTNNVLLRMAERLDRIPEVSATQIYAGTAAPIGFNGLVRQYYLRSDAHQGDLQVTLVDKSERDRSSHEIAIAIRDLLQPIAAEHDAALTMAEVPPGPPVLAPIVAEVYGPSAEQRESAARKVMAALQQVDGIVDLDSTLVAATTEEIWSVNYDRAALLGVNPAQVVQLISTALQGQPLTYLALPNQTQLVPLVMQLPATEQGQITPLQSVSIRNQHGQMIPLHEVVERHQVPMQQARYRKDQRPVTYVMADMTGTVDSPLYGLFAATDNIDLPQTFISQPDRWDTAAVKWDGEWQITYETFRDMGLAYAVGLLLIYLLVVGHFGSYMVPLVIMAPIPLTLIGIMPGHALLGAQFTATSMIGMIALAGIIVRNSILLVDFIRDAVANGMALNDAVINAAAVRAKPIILTGVAAMLGAFFILDDPIFNGLAVSLVFGIAVSTLLTLVVIPLLYASLLKRAGEQ